jgi:hypothetical protein
MKLSDEEASLLVDTIDQAIEGHKEAKEACYNDPALDSPEELVAMMHETDERISTLERIRKKVRKW